MRKLKRVARASLVVPAFFGSVFNFLATRKKPLPADVYEAFGRAAGRYILKHPRKYYDLLPSAIDMLLTPVGVSRFFEFDFCARNLLPDARTILDISSPRLFSLCQASSRPDINVTMANPDINDIEISRKLARMLDLDNVVTQNLPVAGLENAHNEYDAIFSISVLEHISGEKGDTAAINALAGMVRPGGRLVITVPVDRDYIEEYRHEDTYGLQDKNEKGSYLFERRYDLDALLERLVAPVGANRVHMEWAGEITEGWWDRYITAWRRWGLVMRSLDRYRYSRQWKRYDSWSDMPGAGACGIVFEF